VSEVKPQWYRPCNPLCLKFERTPLSPPGECYYVGIAAVSEGDFLVLREAYLAVGEAERYWARRLDDLSNIHE
jgi:hypothetical protein